MAYIGETRRPINTSVAKHRREANKKKENYNSAVAEHHQEPNHSIDWEGAEYYIQKQRNIQTSHKHE